LDTAPKNGVSIISAQPEFEVFAIMYPSILYPFSINSLLSGENGAC
jgi:hypothetical protein